MHSQLVTYNIYILSIIVFPTVKLILKTSMNLSEKFTFHLHKYNILRYLKKSNVLETKIYKTDWFSYKKKNNYWPGQTSCSIHGMYVLNLEYTPGLPANAQFLPNDVTPIT